MQNAKCKIQNEGGQGPTATAVPLLYLSFCILHFAFCICLPSASLAEERIDWLTGPNLRKKLDQPASVAWSGRPLREALEGLSRLEQTAILLDRRVDPGQPMEFSRQDVELRTLLEEIAESRKLGVSFLEPVAYFGPPETARRLCTVAEMRRDDVAKLPNAQRLKWIRLRAWGWEDLAEPRQLLAELAEEGDFEIERLDKAIPHDLWAAASLPPLSLSDRLTLVLAQFDLTFELAGGKLKLVRIPEEVWIERSYPGGRQPQELADQLTERLPELKVRVEQGKLIVRGLLEQHEQIGQGPTRPPKVAATAEKDLSRLRVTLTVTRIPLSVVLENFRQQLGLTIEVDAKRLEQAGKSLEERTSFEIKNASVDEALRAALSPAGLSFRRDEKRVQVTVE